MNSNGANAPVRQYYRISMDREGNRLGVERQQPDTLALIASMGAAPGEVYIDNDLSATKVGVIRPRFEQLLRDLDADPSDCAVWHPDRLVRVARDLERVIGTGVSIHSAHAGHFDLSTPGGRAVARTLTTWAQYEGEQKALRQVAAAKQKSEQGRRSWSTRPFGYETDGTLREDEAEMVRNAYATILQGGSLAAVVRRFNASDLLTDRGNAWASKTIRLHLLNPRNAGISTYHGKEVGAGQWKSIVSEETLRAVQRILTSPARSLRTGGGARVNLLAGLLKCAECKGACRVQWVGGKPSGYAIYTCRAHQHFTARVLQADAYVTGMIVAWLSSEQARTVWAGSDNAEQVERLNDERLILKNQTDELADMWRQQEVTRIQFVDMNRSLLERLSRVEGALARAGQAQAVGGVLMTPERVAAEWSSPDFGLEKRRIVIDMAVETLEARSRGKGVRGFDGDRDLIVQFYDERSSL